MKEKKIERNPIAGESDSVRTEWKTAEEIERIIEENYSETIQCEKTEYAFFVRFNEDGISGELMRLILNEIPNPTYITVFRPKNNLLLPRLQIGFRLKEVEI